MLPNYDSHRVRQIAESRVMKLAKSHRCPACCSDNSEFAFRSVEKSLSLPGYDYNRCLECETLFLSTEISERQLIELHSHAWHEEGEFQLAPVSDQKRVQDGLQLIDQIRVVCGSENGSLRFIDIGSGDGHLCEAARQRGFEAFGLEPSQRAFEHAQNTYRAVRFFNGALEDLGDDQSLIGQGFDVVTFVTSLEHMFDPADAVRRATGLMREKKGALFIQVPNGKSLQLELLQEHAYLVMAPFHRTLFSSEGLESLSRKCGFKIIKTFESPFAWRWTQAVSERLNGFSEYQALRNTHFFREFDYQIDLLLDCISRDKGQPSLLSVLAVRTDE